jgi:hypothetical protein
VHTRGSTIYGRFIPRSKPQGQAVSIICLHLPQFYEKVQVDIADLWSYDVSVASVQRMYRSSQFLRPNNSWKVTGRYFFSRSNQHINEFKVHRLCL